MTILHQQLPDSGGTQENNHSNEWLIPIHNGIYCTNDWNKRIITVMVGWDSAKDTSQLVGWIVSIKRNNSENVPVITIPLPMTCPRNRWVQWLRMVELLSPKLGQVAKRNHPTPNIGWLCGLCAWHGVHAVPVSQYQIFGYFWPVFGFGTTVCGLCVIDIWVYT